MQLSRLVEFHKALGDPTRIRILILLAHSPLHGQAIAGKLGLKPPTITHHMVKLREAGLVVERRVKNTVYFHLQQENVRRKSLSLPTLLEQEAFYLKNIPGHDIILRNFLTPEGRLKTIPAQRKKRLIVLYHLAERFEPGRRYPEREVNQILAAYHEDTATLRREMVVHHILFREQGVYELNPREMWSQPES